MGITPTVLETACFIFRLLSYHPFWWTFKGSHKLYANSLGKVANKKPWSKTSSGGKKGTRVKRAQTKMEEPTVSDFVVTRPTKP